MLALYLTLKAKIIQAAMEQIYILWDYSHLWGLMAWRAIKAFGLSCRLVKAADLIQNNFERPLVLLIPGGSARLKALALGAKGREVIRDWVRKGSVYIGFCGGAGLALKHDRANDGLEICPWQRESYSNRLQHLLSGHIWGKVENQKILLPVWWPGRFKTPDETDISVLAFYDRPGPDLWLADIPIAEIPSTVLKKWRDNPEFPARQPITILGNYGKGKYLLSYAHLETPSSRDANIWLTQLIKSLTGIESVIAITPDWDTSLYINSEVSVKLTNTMLEMLRIIQLGTNLGFFFPRTSWLWGWRARTPGMSLNNLLAALSILSTIKPNDKALNFWKKMESQFETWFSKFILATEKFLWDLRVAKTLESTLGLEQDKDIQHESELRIFGHPMLGGGMIGEIINTVEELIYLSQDSFFVDINSK